MHWARYVFFQDLLYIWWFCKKVFKKITRVFHITFHAFLENKNRLIYGDSEKTSKTHEIAMKNGNFINVFLVKACSIKLSRGKVHGYGGKGRFFKNMILVFLRDIHIFLVLNIVLDQGSFFWSSFFLLLQRYVSKNSKKNRALEG